MKKEICAFSFFITHHSVRRRAGREPRLEAEMEKSIAVLVPFPRGGAVPPTAREEKIWQLFRRKKVKADF